MVLKICLCPAVTLSRPECAYRSRRCGVHLPRFSLTTLRCRPGSRHQRVLAPHHGLLACRWGIRPFCCPSSIQFASFCSPFVICLAAGLLNCAHHSSQPFRNSIFSFSYSFYLLKPTVCCGDLGCRFSYACRMMNDSTGKQSQHGFEIEGIGGRNGLRISRSRGWQTTVPLIPSWVW